VFLSTVELRPDSRELAISSVGPGGTAQVWEWQTGRLVSNLGDTEDTSNVFGANDAEFDPSGRYVVTAAGVGGVVRVWDWRKDLLLHEMEVSREFTNHAAFSPDGQLVVVASSDGSATVWRWSAEKLVADLRAHRGSVEDAAFTPDGSHVLTAGEDRTILVWEWNEPRVVSELLGHADRVVDVKPLPGALALSASLDGTARIWTRLWPIPAKIPRTGGQSVENVEEFTPQGRLLLSNNATHAARIVDVRTGGTVRAFREPRTIEMDESSGPFVRATLARGGSLLVTNSDAGPRVWDARSGKSLAELNAPNRGPGLADIAPDGARVVVPIYDGQVLLWNWRTGRTRQLLDNRSLNIGDARFDPNGRIVAATVGAAMPRTRLWDVASAKPLGSVTGALAGFSPDGKTVMTLADQIYLWDVASRRQVGVLHPPSQTSAAVFTADGQLVVSAHSDAGIRVWNWRTGQLIQTIPGVKGAFGPLAVSLDDRQIAINAFATAVTYPCEVCGPLDRLVELSRRYVTRRLSAEERRRYGI